MGRCGSNNPNDHTAVAGPSLEALGVTTFVDLTPPADPLPRYDDVLRRAQRISHPIVDMATPGLRQMERILDDLDAALAGDGLTYVHCWGGIGRTGTVIGCWLVRHGLDEGDAISRIAQLRRLALDSSMPSPQTTAAPRTRPRRSKRP